MAIAVGEIRTTGNDNNGGFYITGYSPSTDYTQQDTPVLSVSDLATSGAGATTITTATGGVPADAAGNYIHITGGTNFTAGFYLITSVTNTNTFVVSSSPTPSAAGSAGVGAIGGALASPGMAASFAGYAVCWAKAGNYSISSATANISGGLFQPASGQNKVIYGYYQTRGDWPTTVANMPVFTYTATTTGVVLFAGSLARAACIVVDGNNVGSVNGINATDERLCLVRKCSYGFGAGRPIYCAAVNCGTGFGNSVSTCFGCYAEKCTNYGYNVVYAIDCVYYGNGATSGIGFNMTGNIINCVSVGAASDGFKGQNAGSFVNFTAFVNCIAVNNGGYGFNIQNNENHLVYNCAGYNNTSGNLSTYNATTYVINFQALTANPFASATDFSLNNTAGGGAGLRGADYIGAIPVPGFGLASSTTFKRDVGAGQHVDSGGTTVVWPQLVKILGMTDREE